MARILGDAYVVISPDASGFRAKADAAIKRALAGLKYTVPLGVDTEGTLSAIRLLQQRMRQQGLADFLDINIPIGKLITQAQILKRILNQIGLTDVLGVNLDKASLAKAQATISQLSADIPVSFDVSQVPKIPLPGGLTEAISFDISSLRIALGDAQSIADHSKITVPVGFDMSKLPVTGAVESVGVNVSGAQAAQLALRGLSAAEKLAATDGTQLAAVERLLSGPMMANALSAMDARDAFMAQVLAEGKASAGAKILAGDLVNLGLAQEAYNLNISDTILKDAQVKNDIFDVTASLKNQNKYVGDAIPLWKATGGWFGFATGKLQLFGGALTGIGIPAIIGAASAAHILIDAAIEIAAVIIPAGIALAAFGALAAPTFNDIQKKMQAVFVTSTALNTAIYPLTKNLQNLEYAVKPQAINLFGEALVVAEKNTGLFTNVAKQAGNALDTLGARAAVALTSGGLAKFIQEGPKDLATIGDIIANIFGTIGNVLRVIPGYAQQIFGALDGLTKGLEAVTGSGFGQEVLKWGLAIHGAILWMGLGATAAVFLGNALLRLAANFGLVEAGLTVFDAAQFGAGIKAMLSGIGLLAGEMITLGAGEDIAAAGALTLEGAWAAITAINPIVWIGAAIAGIVALVLWLGRAKSATASYDDTVNTLISNAPAGQVAADITGQLAKTTDLLTRAQTQLGKTQEYVIGANARTGAGVKQLSSAYSAQLGIVNGYKGELVTLQGYQANYNQALKAAGGNTSFLTGTSISLNDAITKGGQTLKEYLIEVQANADAQQALALGTGRSAAAQNAQTNIFMTETLPALQKVTAAEDAVVNNLLQGEQAFTSFDSALETYGTDLGLSADKLLGLNKAQNQQASDLYSTVIPAFQKTIDAAQQMGISTKDLTPIVATEAKQILTLAGNNDTARAAMVAVINNALGPGTVSYKTLNGWLKQNSTSQQGLTADWAKATQQASTLAGVLQSDLNAQFAAALLKSSGASQAINNFTDAIVHGGTQTQAYRSARQQLINDLISTGLSASQAKQYVNNLQGQINSLHGKNVSVGVNATGAGQVVITGSGSASIVGAGSIRLTSAKGGLVKMGTGPTADDVPALLSKGETVVSAADSKKLAGAFAAIGVPGYAFGGLAGFVNATSSNFSAGTAKVLQSDAQKVLSADIAKTKAAIAAKAAAAAAAATGGAAGTASPGVVTVAAYVDSHGGIKGTGAGVGGVVAGESGGNPEIIQQGVATPGEGILQWTPGSSAFPIQPIITGNVGRDMGVQLVDMMAYIGSRGGIGDLNRATASGGPMAAAQLFSAMEAPLVPGSDIRSGVVSQLAAMGYRYGGKVMDHGGWLNPGWNPPMYNGTGRPEQIGGLNPGGTITLEISGSTGSGTFDAFLTAWLKNNVRVRGGGNVQRAWGRTH